MRSFCAFVLVLLAIFAFAPPAQAQSVLSGAAAGEPVTAGTPDAQAVLDQVSAGGLSEADLNALVVQLSDEQIRQIFLTVLRERVVEPTVETESTPFFDRIDGKLRRIRQNLGTAFGALQRMNLTGRDTLAVFGQGPVGLSVVMLAHAMGARAIALDVSNERLAIADDFGADASINSGEQDAIEALQPFTQA